MNGILSFLVGVAAGAGRGGGAVATGAAGVIAGVAVIGGIWTFFTRYWFIIIPSYFLYLWTDKTPPGATKEEYSRVAVTSGRSVHWYDAPPSVVGREQTGTRPGHDIVVLVTMRNQNATPIQNYQVACLMPHRDYPYDAWQVGKLTREPETRAVPRYPTPIPANGFHSAYFGFRARMINGNYNIPVRGCRLVSPGSSLPGDLMTENRQTERRYAFEREGALERARIMGSQPR